MFAYAGCVKATILEAANMTKCKKKYDKLVDRAAFIIDFVGNLSARDLKDEGFTKLCDSLV